MILLKMATLAAECEILTENFVSKRHFGNNHGLSAQIVADWVKVIGFFTGLTAKKKRAPHQVRRSNFWFSKRLAFGELEAPTRLALAVFLAFHHPAVAGQETGRLERAAQRRIVKLKRFRNTVLDGAGLA